MRLTPVPALVAAAVTGLGLVAPGAAGAAGAASGDRAYSFAVIGDVPYGPDQLAHFPAFIEQINADPQVRAVVHVGDIKNGSSDCTDAYYDVVRSDFDRFRDPLVYTPGDNEWTDCHRVNARNPLERLSALRSTFFDSPGHTLGSPAGVTSQAAAGFPENVRWSRAGVGFAALHVVGSNNDLAPWTGLGYSAPTDEQVREQRDRMEATLRNLGDAFAQAASDDQPAVVLFMQADMFDPTVPDPQPSDYSAFRPLVQAIVDEAGRYDGQVYLVNGDSHRYHEDRPLAQGSRWLSFYGVDGSADNVKRVTVNGSDLGEAGYLRVSVEPSGHGVLTFEQVPVS